jgi:hypothetical protein
MNKKKIIVVLITFLTLSVLSNVYLLYSNYSLRNILFQEQSSSTPKKKDLMSLMLETEQGSGMYEASKTGEWSDGEYVFNKELSKCENGGELSWDNDKNQVVMVGNSSDKCYLYFNIDTSVTINSFTVTNTETTITISMDAQSTNGAIAKYYYSIDDGENYVSSTSNTYTFSITEIRTYKIKAYAEDGIGRKSGKKSKEQVVTAKPTNPTMAFDSTYNVVISGSTSRNGNVEYYYSLDNKSFTRGSSVTVSSTSTVYAYAVDTKNQKSDVVSKTVTIGTPQTGTVSTTYYCSKTNAYQSSSTCTYNYTGTRSSSPVCNSAMYPTYHNGKCGSRQIYNYSKSECGSWCSDVAYREKPASYACVQEGTGTESWSCYFYSAEDPFPYTCPNGGNLSGSTCIGATYSGSSRYKCSVSGKYYTTKSSATTGCTNYCANGSLYNSKCYYMS